MTPTESGETADEGTRQGTDRPDTRRGVVAHTGLHRPGPGRRRHLSRRPDPHHERRGARLTPKPSRSRTAGSSSWDRRPTPCGARASPRAVRDLAGKAMLPGFIDAHSHFLFALNMVNQVNVAGPPVGPARDIPSTIAALRAYQIRAKIPAGGWIVGWGYDQEGLAEGRHITRLDLDPPFPDHKVMLIHVSGHGAVLNSRALAFAGIDANTKTPPGGIINRLPGSDEPAGLLMETAYLPLMHKLPQPSEAERMALVRPAQMMYAREGYTHAQEGSTFLRDLDFLMKAADEGRFFLDLASLPSFLDMPRWLNNPKYRFGEYHGAVEAPGRQVRPGRLTPGEDGVRHDALSHRGPGRAGELAGGDHPAEGGLPAASEAGPRRRRAGLRPRQRRRDHRRGDRGRRQSGRHRGDQPAHRGDPLAVPASRPTGPVCAAGPVALVFHESHLLLGRRARSGTSVPRRPPSSARSGRRRRRGLCSRTTPTSTSRR